MYKCKIPSIFSVNFNTLAQISIFIYVKVTFCVQTALPIRHRDLSLFRWAPPSFLYFRYRNHIPEFLHNFSPQFLCGIHRLLSISPQSRKKTPNVVKKFVDTGGKICIMEDVMFCPKFTDKVCPGVSPGQRGIRWKSETQPAL